MVASRYYPATDRENNGISEHEDGNFITLVIQDEVGGLEVCKNGEWIPVIPAQGRIVVNISDVIQLDFTDDERKKTYEKTKEDLNVWKKQVHLNEVLDSSLGQILNPLVKTRGAVSVLELCIWWKFELKSILLVSGVYPSGTVVRSYMFASVKVGSQKRVMRFCGSFPPARVFTQGLVRVMIFCFGAEASYQVTTPQRARCPPERARCPPERDCACEVYSAGEESMYLGA
ncbi:hypothetical protein RND71_021889 [Anisodus tanguticus]|uniref:Fe2OG dioxygenase domain-containing protein n=1 Tax=Anisodus tanguticus TaxID=243964 RepID=A0AAE1RXD7_9SOLA|nr:hypothetical protein RND71_021889 [Anisodus tanguticus]